MPTDTITIELRGRATQPMQLPEYHEHSLIVQVGGVSVETPYFGGGLTAGVAAARAVAAAFAARHPDHAQRHIGFPMSDEPFQVSCTLFATIRSHSLGGALRAAHEQVTSMIGNDAAWGIDEIDADYAGEEDEE